MKQMAGRYRRGLYFKLHTENVGVPVPLLQKEAGVIPSAPLPPSLNVQHAVA